MTPRRIVAAGPFFAEILASLHAASFDDAWSSSALAGLLAGPGVFALLALAEPSAGPPEPLGFIMCRVAADECEILTLAVRPERRRQGIAQALLAAALLRAAEAGGRAAFLEVRAGNEAARQLYAKNGFHPVGRRKSYYKDPLGGSADALVLRCELPATR